MHTFVVVSLCAAIALLLAQIGLMFMDRRQLVRAGALSITVALAVWIVTTS